MLSFRNCPYIYLNLRKLYNLWIDRTIYVNLYQKMDNPTNIQPSYFRLFGETRRRSHLDEPVMGHFSRITFHFPGFIILGFKRLKRYENLKYEQFQKFWKDFWALFWFLLVLYTVIDNRCWLYRQFIFFENETAWQIAEIFG